MSIDFLPLGCFDFDEEPLCNAFAALDGHRSVRDILHLDHDFILRSAIILINDTQAVWADKCFLPCKRRAGDDEERVSFGYSHNHVARHKPYLACGNHCGFPCDEVESSGTT